MKKPLLQRKWVWVVGILLIAIGVFEIKAQFSKASEEKARIEATENADKVLKGKVEVPDPYFKSKEEVEKLFKQAGLKPDFVVTNFDEKATLNKRDIKVGDCDQLDSEQPNVKYYDTDEVGDKYGFYADKGATIIVGYTDHDFSGKPKEENSSSTSEELAESSSSIESTSSSESSTPVSSPESEAAETVGSSSEPEFTEMNSNEAIQDYLGQKLKVLEVNGVYVEPGNYTTQITLEGSTSMKSVINQVAQAVRLLNKVDLSQFSNVGISVKTKMTDGELGFAVKSDWDPAFINSEKALTTQNKNVESFASSWWQLQE
ncbi:hypothetical protein [Enterococcus sp. 2201sp1_2201st1_B8_2201SCRN_220225]|uniref:hypothetical protein n=1 Tax=unclassified Enterococcus TaxID=2608891 RepID=UPI0034A1E083